MTVTKTSTFILKPYRLKSKYQSVLVVCLQLFFTG